MTRHLYLDIDPPAYTGSRDHLDRDVFQKKLSVLAARVQPEKVGKFLKSSPLKGYVPSFQKFGSSSLTLGSLEQGIAGHPQSEHCRS